MLRRRPILRAAAGVLVTATLALSACGGSSDDAASTENAGGAANDTLPMASAAPSDPGAASPSPTTGDPDAAVPSASTDDAPGAVPSDPTAVQPNSDIDTNVLPDVVVDNVTTSTKVNLRNVIPADTPVLIWMWAPH